MVPVIITNIKINKVRNVKNIEIPLADGEMKHLIITGKNGSGKTSLLEAMRNLFARLLLNQESFGGANYIGYKNRDDDLVIFLSNSNHFLRDNIYIYVPAHRTLKLNVPQSIEMVEEKSRFRIVSDASEDFIKYMLYLNYQRMSAESEKRERDAKHITAWFDRLLRTLRDIYDCPELELRHDAKNLNYKIIMPDREPFAFNEMADGYSALLKIVVELIMRMCNNVQAAYDAPGIVFIDEIEAHLHVELQKKVLPFLTKMFPKIQFIVSTHSPFVIASEPNAVIYDLEKRVRLEDLTAYSYEGIVEYYYDLNLYSDDIKARFEKYKELVSKDKRTGDENAQLAGIISYLSQIPRAASPELMYSFHEMEETRRGNNYGQDR
jgi:predicted ATP-binding protein involved in virulence